MVQVMQKLILIVDVVHLLLISQEDDFCRSIPWIFRLKPAENSLFPVGTRWKMSGIRRRNLVTVLDQVPGILLPRSVDFRCSPAGSGPYFLTWDGINSWLCDKWKKFIFEYTTIIAQNTLLSVSWWRKMYLKGKLNQSFVNLNIKQQSILHLLIKSFSWTLFKTWTFFLFLFRLSTWLLCFFIISLSMFLSHSYVVVYIVYCIWKTKLPVYLSC
jgi:hypothetical protein